MSVNIVDLLVWYVVFLLSTTFHEFSHAFAAYKGGDLTAQRSGQLSMDPTPHIKREPMGMVVIPVLTMLTVGWTMGWASVPYDPRWARRYPLRQAVMSLAGPMANFALAIGAMIALKLLIAVGLFETASQFAFADLVDLPAGTSETSLLFVLAKGLSVMFSLNVLLGIFNLIPLPPFDGAGVLEGAAPATMSPLYAKWREIPMSGFLALIVAWKLLDLIAPPIFRIALMPLY